MGPSPIPQKGYETPGMEVGGVLFLSYQMLLHYRYMCKINLLWADTGYILKSANYTVFEISTGPMAQSQ